MVIKSRIALDALKQYLEIHQDNEEEMFFMSDNHKMTRYELLRVFDNAKGFWIIDAEEEVIVHDGDRFYTIRQYIVATNRFRELYRYDNQLQKRVDRYQVSPPTPVATKKRRGA